MTTPFGYFDLLESFVQPGCAVCRLLARDVEHYLDILLYEIPTDPTVQDEFRASRGLCHAHTWALTKLNNALPTAILYHAALDELIKIMQRAPQPERLGGLARLLNNATPSPLADALEAKKPCPACILHDESEARYLHVIVNFIHDERLRAAFEQSDGLCLPHFQGALRQAHDPQSARLLTDVQIAKWSALRSELELFMHKSDAHYHGEMGSESNSWLRALARITGEKDNGA